MWYQNLKTNARSTVAATRSRLLASSAGVTQSPRSRHTITLFTALVATGRPISLSVWAVEHLLTTREDTKRLPFWFLSIVALHSLFPDERISIQYRWLSTPSLEGPPEDHHQDSGDLALIPRLCALGIFVHDLVRRPQGQSEVAVNNLPPVDRCTRKGKSDEMPRIQETLTGLKMLLTAQG